MRAANKAGAAWAVIRGDNELAADVAAVKNMISGEQQNVAMAQLATTLRAPPPISSL